MADSYPLSPWTLQSFDGHTSLDYCCQMDSHPLDATKMGLDSADMGLGATHLGPASVDANSPAALVCGSSAAPSSPTTLGKKCSIDMALTSQPDLEPPISTKKRSSVCDFGLFSLLSPPEPS